MTPSVQIMNWTRGTSLLWSKTTLTCDFLPGGTGHGYDDSTRGLTPDIVFSVGRRRAPWRFEETDLDDTLLFVDYCLSPRCFFAGVSHVDD